MSLESIPLDAVLLFVAANICAAFANHLTFVMVAEVNRKLPDYEQISYWWWYWAKWKRVESLYKKHYPSGRLILVVRVLTVLMFLTMFLMAWRLGFFS